MISIPSKLDPDTQDNVFFPHVDLLTNKLLRPLSKINKTTLSTLDVLTEPATQQSKLETVLEYPIVQKELDNALRDFVLAVQHRRSRARSVQSRVEIAQLYRELYNVYQQWAAVTKDLEYIAWQMWYRQLKELQTELAGGRQLNGDEGREMETTKTELTNQINRLFRALGSDIQLLEYNNSTQCRFKMFLSSAIRQLEASRPEYARRPSPPPSSTVVSTTNLPSPKLKPTVSRNNRDMSQQIQNTVSELRYTNNAILTPPASPTSPANSGFAADTKKRNKWGFFGRLG